MGWILTVSLFIGFASAAVIFGWLGARPPDPRRGPRLFPWRMAMILAAALAFYMLVHMVNLAGVTTGR